MRKLMLALLTVVVMGLAMPMAAELCTPDNVPGTTLLLPYFEVDLENEAGITTLFSINNASATAILTHVVLWTDLSVPVLDFDVYLTGYDVVTVNLRDIIADGVLPQTASVGQDSGDSISPQGAFSQDINFASCGVDGKLPPPASLGAVYIAHMQALLTGNPSALAGNRCGGLDYEDGIARGYVTIDTVNACSILFPGDPGYWGVFPTQQNVIWGDTFRIDPSQNFAQGETLVHIEGTGSSFAGEVYAPFVAGDHTFYGRYNAATAIDQREPLPSVYGARYLVGGAFTGGTDFTVWRDSNINQGTFSCSGLPAWYPLGVTQVVIFDEEENPITPEGCPASPCVTESLVIPAEAQLISIGTEELPVEAPFGWIYLNLNTTVAGTPYGDNLAQAWVGANMDADGRFSVGIEAVSLNQLCEGGVIQNPAQIGGN